MLVDADYKFIYVDDGCNGRISDDGVFRNVSLSKAAEENSLNIPTARSLSEGDDALLFVGVADAAFPGKSCLIKPYPHKHLTRELQNLNYQSSRARRVVENAFRILSSRFRLFLTAINFSPDNAKKLLLASCTFHDYPRTKVRDRYTPPVSSDGVIIDRDCHDGNSLNSITYQGTNLYSKDSKQIREGHCS